MLIASRIRRKDGESLIQEGCIWIIFGLLIRMTPTFFYGVAARAVSFASSKEIAWANVISQTGSVIFIVIGAAFGLAGLVKLLRAAAN